MGTVSMEMVRKGSSVMSNNRSSRMRREEFPSDPAPWRSRVTDGRGYRRFGSGRPREGRWPGRGSKR